MGERENLCHRDARVSTPKINYILDSLLHVNIYIRSKTGALSSKMSGNGLYSMDVSEDFKSCRG